MVWRQCYTGLVTEVVQVLRVGEVNGVDPALCCCECLAWLLTVMHPTNEATENWLGNDTCEGKIEEEGRCGRG